MSRNTNGSDPLRPEGLDLSKLSTDEIHKLKDAILERARKTVDPAGTGFDMLMMTTDDGDFFPTDDITIKDWWNWIERVINVISVASTRLGVGVIAAGGAIAASHMFGSEGGSHYARITLGVSAVFALWFVVSAGLAVIRRR